jgi:hypothetical protein
MVHFKQFSQTKSINLIRGFSGNRLYEIFGLRWNGYLFLSPANRHQETILDIDVCVSVCPSDVVGCYVPFNVSTVCDKFSCIVVLWQQHSWLLSIKCQ